MHQVHQTEEDQDDPELENDIKINNFFKINDEKLNLFQALHEYSGGNHPSKAYHKNLSKYVKNKRKRDHSTKK